MVTQQQAYGSSLLLIILMLYNISHVLLENITYGVLWEDTHRSSKLLWVSSQAYSSRIRELIEILVILFQLVYSILTYPSRNAIWQSWIKI